VRVETWLRERGAHNVPVAKILAWQLVSDSIEQLAKVGYLWPDRAEGLRQWLVNDINADLSEHPEWRAPFQPTTTWSKQCESTPS
jgi:hypothetical protein